jgi:hypothetical protein
MTDQDDAADICMRAARLWREALAVVHHGAGCGCCGGGPVRLNDATLGEDVLFFLRHRYAVERRQDLLDILDRYVPDHGVSLPRWLSQASGDQEARAHIGRDILGTLESIARRAQ